MTIKITHPNNPARILWTLPLAAVAMSVTGCNGGSVPTQGSASAQSEAASLASTSGASGGEGAPALSTVATRDAATVQDAFTSVSQAAQPAVVTITTTALVSRGPGQLSGPGGLEEFLRRFGDMQPSSLAPGGSKGARGLWHLAQERGGGLGSGFVYQADGLIMTNAHVVAGADRVRVELADGREFKNAKVLGTDPRTDVAVIKIEAKGLPTLKMGDSSRVRVGEWAIAVGNPFGLEKTLTVGVISSASREVPLSEAGAGDYLQTDASINPGNSGGPLLDIGGRVVGVNNAIYSQSGGNVGIGFAIPINTAREIADLLAKEGRVRRAFLGVGIADVHNGAAAFGLPPDTRGVLVERVEPGSPAARAGLQPGDVITAFNNQPVTRGVDLGRMASRAAIGSTAQLKLLRGGKSQTVSVRMEELKDEAAAPTPAPQPQSSSGALGIALSPLTPDVARQLGINANAGVLIAGVQANSPAQATGLRPGDVIERVGQSAVSTPAQAVAAVKSIQGRQSGSDKSVALYVNRGGERRFVIVGGG